MRENYCLWCGTQLPSKRKFKEHRKKCTAHQKPDAIIEIVKREEWDWL